MVVEMRLLQYISMIADVCNDSDVCDLHDVSGVNLKTGSHSNKQVTVQRFLICAVMTALRYLFDICRILKLSWDNRKTFHPDSYAFKRPTFTKFLVSWCRPQRGIPLNLKILAKTYLDQLQRKHDISPNRKPPEECRKIIGYLFVSAHWSDSLQNRFCVWFFVFFKDDM